MNFKFLIFTFFLLGMANCRKPDTEIANLNSGRIGIIGHGGAGFQSETNQLPHNSFSSVKKAIFAYGADGVEVDIQISGDSTIVLYHDQTLQSMTNCNGCVWEHNTRDIKNCRYNNDFFVNFFANEYIVTLEEVLAMISVKIQKPLLFLDTKLFNCSGMNRQDFSDYNQMFAARTAGLLHSYNAKEWVIVQSQDDNFLIKLKSINPSLKLVLEGNAHAGTIDRASELKLWGVVFQNENISKAEVQRAHQKGLMVSIFDVKTRDGTIKAINKHPDFIQTDNIQLLQQLLRE